MLQFWTGTPGQYYFLGDEQWAATSTGTGLLNTLIPMPVVLNTEQAFDRIAVPIFAGGGAGSVIRVGIYDDSNGVPGSLILDTGTISTTVAALSTDANGNKYVQVTINQTLSGAFWLALVIQVDSPSLRFLNARSNRTGDPQPGSSSPTINALTGVTGALPNPFGAYNGTFTLYPMILMRAA